QSSTRSRTSGSSCATTGSPTASSNPTTISSTIVVRHGTSSSISLGASCPSDCANGPTGSDQWDLVLVVGAINLGVPFFCLRLGPLRETPMTLDIRDTDPNFEAETMAAIIRVLAKAAIAASGKWWRAYTIRRARIAAIRELHTLDDHMLKDIGLSRSE